MTTSPSSFVELTDRERATTRPRPGDVVFFILDRPDHHPATGPYIVVQSDQEPTTTHDKHGELMNIVYHVVALSPRGALVILHDQIDHDDHRRGSRESWSGRDLSFDRPIKTWWSIRLYHGEIVVLRRIEDPS